MPVLTSIDQVDLPPIPDKTYTSFTREWREEFIYFLLVDRFQDSTVRMPTPTSARTPEFPTPDDFYGGTIKGVLNNLDYIAGLGCTAIWLSPVFENNTAAYHGYNINNYLSIDPHFGTEQDMIDLVDAAHNYKLNGRAYPIRIILDVVTNHSGDNWFYKNGAQPNYNNGQRYDFGDWRRPDRPIPVELRNAGLYHCRGSIVNYDTYPENQFGDITSLKDYANDDDAIGSQLINILIKAHCYWIRTADIDGFRVDAVKHMNPLACSRFCSNIREYAYSLGKRDFFLYGEIATPSDDIYNQYLGPNTSVLSGNGTVFIGLDSILDFRLAEGAGGDAGLRYVIEGKADPTTLFDRLAAQQNRALNRGEIGRYLVSFIDNHDSFWQPDGRIGATATDKQVIAGIGFLLGALGTPCIYYGTEQGFSGAGNDNAMREAMFDSGTPGLNALNKACTLYQEIAKIAAVMRSSEPLRFGRMYYRPISGNGIDFGMPYGTDYTLAFSRLLYGREVLVAYNVSSGHRDDYIIVDSTFHQPGDTLTFLYGGVGGVPVRHGPAGLFVQLHLDAQQFVILE